MLERLTPEIVGMIYEYDPTYRKGVYERVIQELNEQLRSQGGAYYDTPVSSFYYAIVCLYLQVAFGSFFLVYYGVYLVYYYILINY